MSKYSVSVIFDACKCVDVEAESPEQAANIAYDEAGYVGLCHQCSGEVEMGDAVRAIVYDESGDEVADDGYQAMELAKITQQCDELLAALKEMQTAYVRLLECGKDRIESLGGQCDSLDFMVSHDGSLSMVEKVIAKANGGV